MTLKYPVAYIISYDLKQPVAKYTPLLQELQRSDKWAHFLTNTWIVLRTETLVELAPKLRGLMFATDRLLIMPAKGPPDGFLPEEAWKWIDENVPREW